MKKKTTTIIDVARATGVSPSTVSHALSGKRVISAPVKKRIFDKIKELDYRPSFYAQALKSNSTRLIGVVVNECRNPSAASYLDCLAEKLEKYSYKPVVAITGLNHDKGVEMLRRLSTGMEYFDRCPLAITAFIPHITYEQTLELLEEFRAQHELGLREFLKTRLDPGLVDRVLHPQNLIALGYKD